MSDAMRGDDSQRDTSSRGCTKGAPNFDHRCGGSRDEPRVPQKRSVGKTTGSADTTLFYLQSAESTDFEVSEDKVPATVDTANRYELLSPIAHGGMGVVYRARDTQLDREVAIKLLRAEYRYQVAVVQRFLDEAKVISHLQHPGIPPVYDAGVCEDGRPFHVMKLVKGNTLSDLLAAVRDPASPDASEIPINFSGLVRIFAEVSSTLAYTHSRGILHLDIKPGNVMVGEFGEVHLMDWGLACSIGSSLRLSEPAVIPRVAGGEGLVRRKLTPFDVRVSGRVRGTPAYMPPEQARGRECDSRSDVFGLGAILCEILTGFPPYRGADSRMLYKQAAGGAIGEANERLEASGRDSTLVRLAKRCLSIRRRDRPRDAREVTRELARYHATALERVEGDLKRFFELSLDMFCIAGFDGYFRRINANFSRVLGISERDLLSRPFIEFVHRDDREVTRQRLGVLLEGQPVVRFRNRYVAADGRPVVFEWTAKSIEEERVIFAVARDVTAAHGRWQADPR